MAAPLRSRVLAPMLASLALSTAFITSTAFEIHGQLAFTLFDDQMISMIYARNLARGHGLG